MNLSEWTDTASFRWKRLGAKGSLSVAARKYRLWLRLHRPNGRHIHNNYGDDGWCQCGDHALGVGQSVERSSVNDGLTPQQLARGERSGKSPE